jgi:hypothetical protein
MPAPLRSLRIMMLCLLALTSLTTISATQLCTGTTPCVTTWHNDLNRTGWQQNETVLTADPNQSGAVNQNTFGLLYRWQSVSGRVYAQPLAVSSVPVAGCTTNCPNVVFVATEQDMLYAFKATSSTGSTIWSPLNLAAVPPGPSNTHNGEYVDCTGANQEAVFPACGTDSDTGLNSPFHRIGIGVTGSPVVDVGGGAGTNTLYVVGAVYFPDANPSGGYYLFAVDITSGNVKAWTPISGSVSGLNPGETNRCTSDYPAQGPTQFNNAHIQRSALLLLNGTVYVAFGDFPEHYNGWMFAYTLQNLGGGNYSFQQGPIFSTTPYGTGGGIWQSGAGPASDGSFIFVATANGTLFDPITQNIPYDLGDSLLKLDSSLTVRDFYAPPDAGYNRCYHDIDLGSGGVLLPSGYTYTGNITCVHGCSVVINADKESNLYVADQAYLGGFNASTDCKSNFNNIQCITTPAIPSNDTGQGYWASPAYWHYADSQSNIHYMLYHSASMQSNASKVTPEAINAYQLQTSGSPGPIPSATPFASTSTLFCDFSPTPSVSSNGTTAPLSGIVWATEQNQKPTTTEYIARRIAPAGIPKAIRQRCTLSAMRPARRAGPAPRPLRRFIPAGSCHCKTSPAQSTPFPRPRSSTARCIWERTPKSTCLAFAAARAAGV